MCGSHSGLAYSAIGRTSVLYAFSFTVIGHILRFLKSQIFFFALFTDVVYMVNILSSDVNV